MKGHRENMGAIGQKNNKIACCTHSDGELAQAERIYNIIMYI